jgi:nitric oxide dioxygenase
MLNEKTMEIIKSTVPVLQENGVALTTLFYKNMFENNPEVKKFFDMNNQEDGTQPKALARAIVAYAKNIDKLENLGSAVERIAQKHASLKIKPEHYPIVGQNLIATIKELLDLDDDSEIVKAWVEAYGLLANILIDREAEIYAEQK